MTCSAAKNISGLQCPVRGCKNKHNRRFNSTFGLCMHISAIHGEEELVKRLRTKWSPMGK